VEATGYDGVLGTHARTATAWIKTTALGEIISWGQNVTGQKWIFRVQNSNGQAGAIRVEVSGGYQAFLLSPKTTQFGTIIILCCKPFVRNLRAESKWDGLQTVYFGDPHERSWRGKWQEQAATRIL
jgi:hypothetical protein